MKQNPRVRESCVKRFPSGTVTGYTRTCLGLNGTLRSRGDRELHISKEKKSDFENFLCLQINKKTSILKTIFVD